jgi:hypothetical protein
MPIVTGSLSTPDVVVVRHPAGAAATPLQRSAVGGVAATKPRVERMGTSSR